MRGMLLRHVFALLLAGVVVPASAQGGPIRIGVLTDMSGVLADTLGPGSLEAARMAAEDNGDVLGRKVEVLSADHQNKADIGAAIARRWYDSEGVGLILDLGNSAVGLAVQGIAKEKDRITISTGAATSELTNKSCSTNSFRWGYDSYQMSSGATGQLVRDGADSWYFVVADYAFGHAIEADAGNIVKANGGKVLGSVRYPVGTTDFSSFLLQAQASGAKIIAIANAVTDLQNTLKQGNEFQIFGQKQRAAAPVLLLVDIHSVGLKATQGTTVSTVFYWDQDEKSRAFAERFRKRFGRPPTEAQAMNYSAVLHYLKAIKAAGSAETGKVLAKMRELPVEDAATPKPATIRADGRLMREIRLARVKTPEESKGPWDYLKVLGLISAEDAFRPVAQSACPLLKR